MHRLIAAVLVVSTLSACASTPDEAPLMRIPDDTRVRLTVIAPASGAPNASRDGGRYAKNISGGALAGAGMGAAYGFMAGFACGPMVVICGPAGMVGGAMGGAIFGIAAGTFTAASLQLPQEKAAAFDAIIAKTYADTSMTDVLSERFMSNTETSWSYVNGGESVSITLILDGVGIHKHKDDNLSVSVISTLRVQSGIEDSISVDERQFVSSSVSHHLDYWIENDGANFLDQIELRISDNAWKMASVLKSHDWTPYSPKIEELPSPPPANFETFAASVEPLERAR